MANHTAHKLERYCFRFRLKQAQYSEVYKRGLQITVTTYPIFSAHSSKQEHLEDITVKAETKGGHL